MIIRYDAQDFVDHVAFLGIISSGIRKGLYGIQGIVTQFIDDKFETDPYSFSHPINLLFGVTYALCNRTLVGIQLSP